MEKLRLEKAKRIEMEAKIAADAKADDNLGRFKEISEE